MTQKCFVILNSDQKILWIPTKKRKLPVKYMPKMEELL